MGKKNRVNLAAKKAKITERKVINKKNERKGRHGARAHKEIKKARESGKLEVQSRSLKKFLKRRALRDRVAALGGLIEKEAPVRPEDLDAVIAGKASVRELAMQNIAKGQEELKERIAKRKAGLSTSVVVSRVVSDEEDDEEDHQDDVNSSSDGEDEEDNEENFDSNDDDNDDDEDDDADTKPKLKSKSEQLAEKISALSKPIAIQPHKERSLRAQGIDPKAWLEERNMQRLKMLEELKRKNLTSDARKINQLLAAAKIKRDDQGNIVTNEIIFSSDSEEEEEEEEQLLRVAGSWMDVDLESAKSIAQIRAERTAKRSERRKAKLSADKIKSRSKSVDKIDDSEAAAGSDASLNLDGPDDDDDGGNAFENLSGNESPESNSFGMAKMQDVSKASQISLSTPEELHFARSVEKLKEDKRQAVLESKKLAKIRLPIRKEDGTWEMKEVSDAENDEGKEIDASERVVINGKVLSAGLEKYKRLSKKDKDVIKSEPVKEDKVHKSESKEVKKPKPSQATESIALAMKSSTSRAASFKYAAMTEVEFEKQRLQSEHDYKLSVLKEAHEVERRSFLMKANTTEGTQPWYNMIKKQEDEIAKQSNMLRQSITKLENEASDLSNEMKEVTRAARIRRIQISLASLCQELLSNPEEYVTQGNLEIILGVARNDTDPAVRQLALVSAVQVMVDIIPLYRVRIPTKEDLEKEKKMCVILSKDVLNARRYEKKLVEEYTTLVRICTRTVRKVMASDILTSLEGSEDIEQTEQKALKGMPLVAIKGLCKLFERGYNFNYAKEICAFLASVLTSRFALLREVVAESVKVVFKDDTAGDATLEIVRAISSVFKERGGDRIRSSLLEVLLHLPLDREILTKKEETVRPGGGTEYRRGLIQKNIIHRSSKKRVVKGAGNHVLNAKLEAEYRARLEAKGKLGVLKKLDEERAKERSGGGFGAGTTMKLGWAGGIKKVDKKKLDKDLAESEAEVSIDHRKRAQTAILSAVFTIYFRYLKQAPSLRSLYERNPEAKTVPVRVGFRYSANELESKKEERDAKEQEKKKASAEDSDAIIAQKDAEAARVALNSNEAFIRGKKVELGLRTGVPEAPPPPPSHMILKAVLDGINKFSYLINLELLLDLLEHLKLVVAASARVLSLADEEVADPLSQRLASRLGISESKAKLPKAVPLKHEVDEEIENQSSDDEDQVSKKKKKRVKMDSFIRGDKIVVEEGSAGGVLPLQSALLCVYTAFQLLRMHNNAIRIDLSAYYKFYYELMWQLAIPEELPHFPLALQCFELMMLEQRDIPPPRAAALCRRALIVSHMLKPNVGLSLVHAVGQALLRNPKAQIILENEAHATGQYDPLITDPDLSCGLGSPAWELALWPSSYHPFGEAVIAQAINTPEVMNLTKNRGNAAKVAQEISEAAYNARMENSYNTTATTLVKVKIGDEQVSLSRFKPTELLRIMDATRGGFVPDIVAPGPLNIALTFPDQVTPNIERQAVGRARNIRSQIASEPVNVRALLPPSWQSMLDNARMTAGLDVSSSSSQASGKFSVDPTTKALSPSSIWPLKLSSSEKKSPKDVMQLLGKKRSRK